MQLNISVLPRVLFENLLPDDVVSLNVDNQRKSQLVSALVEIAKVIDKKHISIEKLIQNNFIYN